MAEKINARTILMEDESFVNGVRATTQVMRHTFFRPNLLFLLLRPDSDLDELQQLVDKTTAYKWVSFCWPAIPLTTWDASRLSMSGFRRRRTGS
jgi:hypothetical protein